MSVLLGLAMLGLSAYPIIDEGGAPPPVVVDSEVGTSDAEPEPEAEVPTLVVPPPPVHTVQVRLTYYNLSGRTANGEYVHHGGTACSRNWSMGTRFRFPNGEVFICNDRGLLGSSGWLDVWGRPDLTRIYGSYVAVEVL